MSYHYRSCDAETIGRHFLAAVQMGQEFVSVAEITTDLDAHRPACGCAGRQLSRITDELRRARRRAKTNTADLKLISDLIRERDALMLAVTAEDKP